MLDGIPNEIADAQKKATPIPNRVGIPSEIVCAVAWLLDPESAWVLGHNTWYLLAEYGVRSTSYISMQCINLG